MKKVKSILFLMIGICLLSMTNVKAYTYTIKYNANGGSGKVSNQSIKSSTWSALNANKFTKKGYTFVGWNTTKDSKGIGFRNKQEVYNLVNKAGSKTLYAMWTKTKYTIKYNLNGGKNNSKNPNVYYITSATKTLLSPTRTGYRFLGWYKESTFKTKVTSIKSGSTGNVTLYAKWTPITYTVVYNANGGTGTMTNSTSLKYNTSYNLKANTFKKTGYIFDGWNTKADGTGKTYAENASIKNLTNVNGKTITLYAKWVKGYTVKFLTSIDDCSSVKCYDTAVSLFVKEYSYISALEDFAVDDKYVFDGWYTDSNYENKFDFENTQITNETYIYGRFVEGERVAVGTNLSIKVNDNHTENFYVINDDGDYLYALAKNNLYVGQLLEETSEGTYGVTDNIESTDENYLYQNEEANDTHKVSGLTFADDIYWVNTATLDGQTLYEYKTDYYASFTTNGENTEPYLYDENSNLYPYLTEYATRLSNNVSVSASLISYEQLQKLNCLSKDSCNYDWIYNGSYWTAYSYSSSLSEDIDDFSYIKAIYTDTMMSTYYTSTGGVRPVIKIEKSKLNLDDIENGIEI